MLAMAVTQTTADDDAQTSANPYHVAAHIAAQDGLKAEVNDVSTGSEERLCVVVNPVDEALSVPDIREKFGWKAGTVQASGRVYLRPMH